MVLKEKTVTKDLVQLIKDKFGYRVMVGKRTYYTTTNELFAVQVFNAI